jgi:SPP1 gp7 family putative phage head morphogenesis protein
VALRGFFHFGRESYVTGGKREGEGGGPLDEESRKAAMRKELKKMQHGKKEVTARYHAKYPESAEREYIRLCNAYMAMEKQVLMKHIPELSRILEDGAEMRRDAASGNGKGQEGLTLGMMRRLRRFFANIRKELDTAFGLKRLTAGIEKIAAQNRRLTVKEWKKTVSKTLGIDIMEDYFSGGVYEEMLKEWISENIDLIKAVPQASLEKMEGIVYANFRKGTTTPNIVKEIQRQYGMDKRHAKLIARDQTAKLNAALTKYQQTDAGITHYKWSDSRDSRVRESHKRLNGRIFSWDNPPETEHGRKCHPGQDYQCRCCALAVFDIDNIDLPMEGRREKNA